MTKKCLVAEGTLGVRGISSHWRIRGDSWLGNIAAMCCITDASSLQSSACLSLPSHGETLPTVPPGVTCFSSALCFPVASVITHTDAQIWRCMPLSLSSSGYTSTHSPTPCCRPPHTLLLSVTMLAVWALNGHCCMLQSLSTVPHLLHAPCFLLPAAYLSCPQQMRTSWPYMAQSLPSSGCSRMSLAPGSEQAPAQPPPPPLAAAAVAAAPAWLRGSASGRCCCMGRLGPARRSWCMPWLRRWGAVCCMCRVGRAC